MKNKFDSAKQIFEDAMFLDKNPEIENMLAQIYMKEENYSDAIGLFADIDKKYPTNTANLMNLAKCEIMIPYGEHLCAHTNIVKERR